MLIFNILDLFHNFESQGYEDITDYARLLSVIFQTRQGR